MAAAVPSTSLGSWDVPPILKYNDAIADRVKLEAWNKTHSSTDLESLILAHDKALGCLSPISTKEQVDDLKERVALFDAWVEKYKPRMCRERNEKFEKVRDNVLSLRDRMNQEIGSYNNRSYCILM